MITYGFYWDTHTTGWRGSWIQINNANPFFSPSWVNTNASEDTAHNGSLTIPLTDGQTVQIMGFQNSGGNLNIQSAVAKRATLSVVKLF